MKSVVISGSVKFIKKMHKWIKELESKGVKVYYPEDLSFRHLEGDDLRYAVAGATFGYFHKIRKADVMLLFNVGGYAGVSTTLELGYATACAKPVVSLEKDDEYARSVLIEKQVKSPKELIEYLEE